MQGYTRIPRNLSKALNKTLANVLLSSFSVLLSENVRIVAELCMLQQYTAYIMVFAL